MTAPLLDVRDGYLAPPGDDEDSDEGRDPWGEGHSVL